MRILLALVAGLIFVALMLIDPALLFHATVYCVTEGCEVPIWWLPLSALAGGAFVWLSLHVPRPKGRTGSGKAARPRRPKPERSGRTSQGA